MMNPLNFVLLLSPQNGQENVDLLDSSLQHIQFHSLKNPLCTFLSTFF